MTREKLKKLNELQWQIDIHEKAKFILPDDLRSIVFSLPCSDKMTTIYKSENEELFKQAYDIFKKLSQRDSNYLLKLKEQFETENLEYEKLKPNYNPHISQPEEIKFNIKTDET